MPNPFVQPPAPHLFMGGNPSDYTVGIGKAGTYFTKHLPSGQTIQSVQPGAANMLPAANLFVNLLNLGVGVYNAYQLHEVKGYLGNIQGALSAQYRMLEVLAAQQYSLTEQMKVLRQEMHLGFERVVKEINDAEARRRREEFEQRTFKLLRAYERFCFILPETSEADGLLERAEDLEAWLQPQMRAIEPGKAERLPLVVAHTFSIRAKADALQAKGGKYAELATIETDKLQEKIQQEAYDFCNGKSLYTLGVEMPEIVAQYVYLNRGLQKSQALPEQANSEILFSAEELAWDDGLTDLRQVFQTKALDVPLLSADTHIVLNTLADYNWYIQFKKEDPTTFSVHSCPSLSLSEILFELGHPNPQNERVAKCSLKALTQLALPITQETLMLLLKKEFHWSKQIILSTSCKRNFRTITPRKLTREEVINLFKRGERDFSGFDLSQVDLSGTDLSWSCFSGCLLEGTSFADSKLYSVNFKNSFLENSTFERADCKCANFQNAWIIGAKFLNSDLRGANFTFTRIEQDQINGSLYNDSTRFPYAEAGIPSTTVLNLTELRGAYIAALAAPLFPVLKIFL